MIISILSEDTRLPRWTKIRRFDIRCLPPDVYERHKTTYPIPSDTATSWCPILSPSWRIRSRSAIDWLQQKERHTMKLVRQVFTSNRRLHRTFVGSHIVRNETSVWNALVCIRWVLLRNGNNICWKEVQGGRGIARLTIPAHNLRQKKKPMCISYFFLCNIIYLFIYLHDLSAKYFN